MKIKFTTSLAGADFCRNPGDVADVPDAEAHRLIAAGYAVPVKGKGGKTEKATEPSGDNELAIAPDVTPKT